MNFHTNQPDIGAPGFPVETLPNVIKDSVEAIAKNRRVPPVILASAALATIAASLGRGIVIRSGSNRTTYGNLYFCITARSGTGKSSIALLTGPLHDLEQTARIRYRENIDYPGSMDWGFGMQEGGEVSVDAPKRRATLLDKARGKIPPTYSTAEATGPGLEKILQSNNEVTFIVSSEAGAILRAISRPNSSLESLLLQGFMGERYQRFDAHKMTELEDPRITALLLTQPSRLDDLLADRRLIESGLAGRMLVAHSEGGMLPIPKEGPPEIPAQVLGDYEVRVGTIFERYYSIGPGEPAFEVTASPEARWILDEFQRETAESYRMAENEVASDLMARWPEMAWRLSLVLHVAEHGAGADRTHLSPETAGKAVVLVRWFGAQAQAVAGQANPGGR